MNLKQTHQECILNHPEVVKTAKSSSHLTFRQIAGIRESAFSISLLFTKADGKEIIRSGFANQIALLTDTTC